MDRYADGARTLVTSSAAPYGYTLTIWGSGATLAATAGPPGLPDVFAFIGAAAIAFIGVGALAFGGFRPRASPAASPFSWWQWLDLPAVGVPVGVTATFGWLIGSAIAWPLGGAVATAGYLAIAGLQMALSQHSSEPGAGGDA